MQNRKLEISIGYYDLTDIKITNGIEHAMNPSKDSLHAHKIHYESELKNGLFLLTVYSTSIEFKYEINKKLIVKANTDFIIKGADKDMFNNVTNPDLIALTAELTLCHLAHIRGELCPQLEKTEFRSSNIPRYLTIQQLINDLSISFSLTNN